LSVLHWNLSTNCKQPSLFPEIADFCAGNQKQVGVKGNVDSLGTVNR
jgi:hypothetical protein